MSTIFLLPFVLWRTCKILDQRLPNNEKYVYLTSSMIAALRLSIEKCLAHYKQLQHAANTNKKMLWNVTSKFHKIWHIGFEAQLSHPRFAQCCGGEDFVRII